MIVMFILGTVWCLLLAAFQGETPGEPWDDGHTAGVAVQFVVVGALLILLWTARAPSAMIVSFPILDQLLIWFVSIQASRGPFESAGDFSDASTFSAAFVPMVIGVVIATALVGAGAFGMLKYRKPYGSDAGASPGVAAAANDTEQSK
ncbi:MAG: hypothetical protein ICV64_03580 [Thermoleophilia bacterium]|nr:hypothetical protein [Thermoleophilia bacterium]